MGESQLHLSLYCDPCPLVRTVISWYGAIWLEGGIREHHMLSPEQSPGHPDHTVPRQGLHIMAFCAEDGGAIMSPGWRRFSFTTFPQLSEV